MFSVVDLNDVFAKIEPDEGSMLDRRKEDYRKIVAADTMHFLHFNGS